jgi:hypothetical protein
MSIEIIPHRGFGLIKFGMTKETVESIIGKPTDVYDEEMDGITEIVVDYENIGVDLSFSSADNYKLGTMSFYEVDTRLFGEEFIGLTEDELLDMAEQVGISDLELEDDFDEIDSKDYYSDAHGISFWVQDGVVDSITVFPAYDPEDEETVIWPE